MLQSGFQVRFHPHMSYRNSAAASLLPSESVMLFKVYFLATSGSVAACGTSGRRRRAASRTLSTYHTNLKNSDSEPSESHAQYLLQTKPIWAFSARAHSDTPRNKLEWGCENRIFSHIPSTTKLEEPELASLAKCTPTTSNMDLTNSKHLPSVKKIPAQNLPFFEKE